ncbi:Mobile element protein [uncultured Gammaproteobacteria bacterium]|nr:Mobile element protein [uncultured Gammaproteobacteria bacterium]
MSCLNSTSVLLSVTFRGYALIIRIQVIKKITKPMMGFKAFHSAQATIAGIETAHMIRKGQLSEENIPAYKQFMALAG